LILLLCLTACGSKMPYDLSGTTSVELHAYNNDSTEPFAKIVVDGEDAATIVEMFSSLKLKELDYTEPSINGYEFWFRDTDGNQIAKLSLPYGPSPWVVAGGTAYQDVNGGVDLDYLAQLVDITVSAGPEPSEDGTGSNAPDEPVFHKDANQTKSSDSSEDDEQCAAKPVIYLYPENEIDVSVKLDYSGKLTCSYPSYNDGWSVSACPDGTLTDTEGQSYNYLYWEGVDDIDYDFSEGFCIAGNETAAFLEDALNRLGLTRREANEFIVYWLPLMQESPYNLISFQSDVYTQAAKLTVDPAPDTLLRVFMAWKPLGSTVDIPVQDLNAVPRTGFTVVEWGGCQVK